MSSGEPIIIKETEPIELFNSFLPIHKMNWQFFRVAIPVTDKIDN